MRSTTDEEYVTYVSARLPALKRLAYLLCGDEHRADDLVPESVAKLYMRWAAASKTNNLDRYVRSIPIRSTSHGVRYVLGVRTREGTHVPSSIHTDGRDEYVAYVTARLPALKRLAYLLCGDNHRADDLVQESVTKLYVRWAAARKADNLDRYVRAIVVRTHIDDTRRPWSRVRLGALPDHQLAPAHGPEDRAVIRAALATLPPGQRAVLVLRFLCDVSVLEVGELLGCSEGSVKTQTARGLAKLRRLLGEREFALITKEG